MFNSQLLLVCIRAKLYSVALLYDDNMIVALAVKFLAKLDQVKPPK